MNENIKYIAAAAGVVGLSIGAVVYFSYQSKGKPAPPSEPPVVAAPAPPAMPAEPPSSIRFQHPRIRSRCRRSMTAMGRCRTPSPDLIGKESVEQFVIPKDLVRHIVVSVDNLPARRWPNGFAP